MRYTQTEENVVLCQHIIVGRDSEIAPTDGLLMVGGNSGECHTRIHTVDLDSRLLSRPIN